MSVDNCVLEVSQMSYEVGEGAIAEVQYRYKMNGQQCINVFHYKYLGGTPVDGRASIEDIAESFHVLVGGALQALQTTDVTEVHVRAQWVYPTRYTYATFIPTIQAGLKAPPTLSVGTSVVMKKLADLAGQSHRGRIYLGGCAVYDALVGEIIEAELEPYIEAAANFDELLPVLADPNLMRPVIWSYTDPLNPDDIVDTAVDRALRYQRRREVGRGE